MDNFKWPSDALDWGKLEPRYIWRGIQPNGRIFYSITKPSMTFVSDGSPCVWTSFTLRYPAGRTQDQEAIKNWANSLQTREQYLQLESQEQGDCYQFPSCFPDWDDPMTDGYNWRAIDADDGLGGHVTYFKSRPTIEDDYYWNPNDDEFIFVGMVGRKFAQKYWRNSLEQRPNSSTTNQNQNEH